MKEIQKIKIAITSDCCLSCRHCGIDKKSGKHISTGNAFSAVRELIRSPGNFKRLELYGGEPFMHFGQLKKIAGFARQEARAGKKRLSVSVATNAVMLTEDHLRFLRDENINISVSFSGLKKTHDHMRVFPGGGGSFDAVLRKVPMILGIIGWENVVALNCVHPKHSSLVFKEYLNIKKIGFKLINIECIHGPDWSDAQIASVASGAEKMCVDIEEEAERGNFIFPETFLAYFGDIFDKEKADCPFYRDLEMYPDGTYSLYPYAFINYERDLPRVRVGTASGGFIRKFASCKIGCGACGGCVRDYYTISGLTGGSFAYSARTAALKKGFLRILKRSGTDLRFRKYMTEAIRILEENYAAP